MEKTDKIDIDILKVVISAVSQSQSLDTMGAQLAQLLVSTLDIKGVAIFAVNPVVDELEILASFGLSVNYINKGPVMLNRSIGWATNKNPVVICDVSDSDHIQYPAHAKEEGVVSIVSIPIIFHERIIGALRLYHSEKWDVSERDIDSLKTIAGTIGMAFMYTRVLTALKDVKNIVGDIHAVWLDS